MAHVFEIASSGRAKCRGCESKIDKGALRFGERQPNSFGEGEMTLWFHPRCAAYKRPEPFLEAFDRVDAAVDGAKDADTPLLAANIDVDAVLKTAAQYGIVHRRLPRLNGADRAPTGRARCRSCRELIDKDSWRIGLTFFEEYRFQAAGFIHAGCAQGYFETTEIVERVKHFSPDLGAVEITEFQSSLEVA